MSVIETARERGSWSATESAPWINEDWLSVVIGLAIFVLALAVLVALGCHRIHQFGLGDLALQ